MLSALYEKLEQQVLEISERTLGTEHPDTLMAIINLTDMYNRHGQWKEAEKLERKMRTLGAEHSFTLMRKANLARKYSDQGQWKEAEKLERQVYRFLRTLGAGHPFEIRG